MNRAWLSITALAVTASAQTPYIPRAEIYVNDSNNDRIAFLADLGNDGGYNDASDVRIFYDDTVGPFALSNNVGLAASKDGTVYVCDSSADQVLRMKDSSGDGDANDPGEATLFFESFTNAAGIGMISASGMDLDGSVLWIAVSQSGTTGKDYILRLEDLNADGDAQDANEAREYYVISDLSMGGAANDSLPQDVHVGLDGNIYYLEGGTTGVNAKGIHKLVDANLNGVIDPGEETTFFAPPALSATPFYWGMDQGPDGAWYMADTGNDLIWRALDANNDGQIVGGEAVQWWNSPGASLIWNVRVAADGYVYAGESQNNERIFLLKDLDQNGTVNPSTEMLTVYDELSTLGVPIGQLRNWILEPKWQEPSVNYCATQTSSTGCVGSMGWSGWPSASHGSGYFLTATQMRNQKAGLLFHGTAGRQATPFNGGTMCIASPRIRTPLQQSGGSTSGDDCTGTYSFDMNAYIAAGTNPALVLGAVVDAQYWSRDPGSPPGNTNLTNAVEFCVLR